ncbi:MAG: ANTAR domain-containing protein [Planctomycetaceae bacterium]|nr:ANTAR domain-containing protein [Planctomycetaceae bacterium]
MENALIVSSTKKSIAFFTEMLAAASIKPLAVLESADEARRLFGERDIDLVIVDSPLRDESGESLARHVASTDVAQVLFVVSGEHVDAVSAVCENDGVLVLARPLNKSVFWSALKLAGAAQRRLMRIQAENDKLKRQLEDIRIIHRAKCELIFHHKISEQQAHRLIEKRAMDVRSTRRAVAEEILKNHENASATK